MDLAIIEATTLPGVLPGKQARSRKVVQDLVAAALELLADRDFTALSIADVCAQAGVTAGAFYKRFESKDLFVEYLQRLVVEETRRNIPTAAQVERLARLPLAVFLEKTVAATARWYWKYEGFARASLRWSQAHPRSWSPLRETGVRYAAAVEPVIARIVGRTRGGGELTDAIRFSIQQMIGTFNTMVLIDPGPYRLRNRRTLEMMVRSMTLMIEDAARRER